MKNPFYRRQGHYYVTWYTHVTAELWRLRISISRYIEKGNPLHDGYHINIEWMRPNEEYGNPHLEWTIYPHMKELRRQLAQRLEENERQAEHTPHPI